MTTYKLLTIAHNGQESKFKIVKGSKSSDIKETLKSRFHIPDHEQLILVDDQDQADVVIDDLLESGRYHLYVASDLGSCCPSGSLPATEPEDTYTTKGKWEDIGGTEFYVVGKKEEKQSGIIIFADVYGPKAGRHRQVADELALSGFLVLLPDIFGKESKPEDPNQVEAWIKKFPWSRVSLVFNTAIGYFEKHGISKIGAIGFCWGTWAVLHASASGKISAGLNYHPSHPRLAPRHGEDAEKLVENVKCPQFLFHAGNDDASVKKGGSNEKIFNQKEFGSLCGIKEFPEMTHGWMVRGDVKDEKVKRDVREGLRIGVALLKKLL